MLCNCIRCHCEAWFPTPWILISWIVFWRWQIISHLRRMHRFCSLVEDVFFIKNASPNFNSSKRQAWAGQTKRDFCIGNGVLGFWNGRRVSGLQHLGCAGCFFPFLARKSPNIWGQSKYWLYFRQNGHFLKHMLNHSRFQNWISCSSKLATISPHAASDFWKTLQFCWPWFDIYKDHSKV